MKRNFWLICLSSLLMACSSGLTESRIEEQLELDFGLDYRIADILIEELKEEGPTKYHVSVKVELTTQDKFQQVKYLFHQQDGDYKAQKLFLGVPK